MVGGTRSHDTAIRRAEVKIKTNRNCTKRILVGQGGVKHHFVPKAGLFNQRCSRGLAGRVNYHQVLSNFAGESRLIRDPKAWRWLAQLLLCPTMAVFVSPLRCYSALRSRRFLLLLLLLFIPISFVS